MICCGQMRCWACLTWSLLMLCLTAVGVKVQAAAHKRAAAPVSSSSIAQWMAAIEELLYELKPALRAAVLWIPRRPGRGRRRPSQAWPELVGHYLDTCRALPSSAVHQHLSGFERGLVVRDPLIKPDEHLAGFPSDDGGFVVGPGEAADGVRVIEERQGHKLGLRTESPPQQPRSPKSRNLPQGSHDLGAIVLLVAICMLRTRPASPHPCDHNVSSSAQTKHHHAIPCHPPGPAMGCRAGSRTATVWPRRDRRPAPGLAAERTRRGRPRQPGAG